MMIFAVAPIIYDKHRKPRTMIVEDILGAIPAETSVSRRVIDLGCGTGAYASEIGMRLGIPIFGVDASYDMVARAATKKHIEVFQYDCGRGLTGDFGSFSFVYAVNFLHYVEELESFFRSVHRSLHKGGCLYLAIHTQDDLAQQTLGKYFPATIPIESALIHSVEEITETLESVGFAEIAVSTLQQRYQLTVEHFEAFRSGAYNRLQAIQPESIDLGLSKLLNDIDRDAMGLASYTIVKAYKNE